MPMIVALLTCALLAVFTGTGDRACRILRLSFDSLSQQLAFCGALGMGLTGYAVLILGLLGAFRPLPLAVLSSGLFTVACVPAMHQAGRGCRALRELARKRDCILPLTLVAAALAIGLIGVLGPEIGNDALCYHLNCPKLFLSQGRIAYIPYDPNSHFPFLLQNLYGLGLALQGPGLAKAFHWMTGLFTALALYAFLKKDLGQAAGMTAAAAFLLVPGIFNQLGIAYVDVGLTCFSFLSLYAFILFFEDRRIAHAVLAGCFMGFALSVKYLALVSLGVFAMIVLVIASRRRSTLSRNNPFISMRELAKRVLNLVGIFRGTAVFIACAVFFSFFWYIKSYWVFGNPIHPFYESLFGVHFMPMSYHNYSAQGAGKGFSALLRLPWNMTMRPLLFEDFGAQIGPVFLAFLPGLLFVRNWPLRWKIVGAYSAFYTLIWFFMGQNMRFWYPVVPAVSALTAAAVFARAPGRLIRGLLALFLGLELVLGLYHYRSSIQTFWSRARTQAYLARSERTYRLAQWIVANLPAGAKIIASDETHGFWIRPRVVRENYFRRCTRYDERCKTPGEAIAFLKKEGFTHVLHAITVHTPAMQAGQGPLRLEMLLRDRESKDRYFRLLHEQRFEREGEDVEYFVFEIRN